MSTITQQDIEAITGPITLTGKGIPFSQSRSKDQEWKNLNWRLSLAIRGKAYAFDYSAGTGHIDEKTLDRFRKQIKLSYGFYPGYAPPFIHKEMEKRKAEYCETGNFPLPDIVNVFSCLLLDAQTIDQGSFESWCSEYGYDTDSRSAYASWQEGINVGLWFRSVLSSQQIEQLQTLFQDY